MIQLNATPVRGGRTTVVQTDDEYSAFLELRRLASEELGSVRFTVVGRPEVAGRVDRNGLVVFEKGRRWARRFALVAQDGSVFAWLA